jgi:hypothetical protein
MGEDPLPELNQSTLQAGLERERELTDDHDQGILDGRIFNQGKPAGSLGSSLLEEIPRQASDHALGEDEKQMPMQTKWTIGTEPEPSAPKTVVQIRGYSIVYDQRGQFLGYSDDEEDIANTKKARAEIGDELLFLRDARFMTDVPWKNPPMSRWEFEMMDHLPQRDELRRKWSEWFEWQKQRYRPCLGEIRTALDGRQRTIFSTRPDHTGFGERPKLDPKKENQGNPIIVQNQNHKPPPPPLEGDPIEMNKTGQSKTQETITVESHNLQSSEGQLRKPADVGKVDVTATFCLGTNKVTARSDDLLALKAENQLELDLSGKAEVRSCLTEDLGPDFQVRKSEAHPNCSLVRPVNPELPPDSPTLRHFKQRRKAMAEIEHFLGRDWNFSGLTPGLCSHHPDSKIEREAWLAQFFGKVYRNHDFKNDQS